MKSPFLHIILSILLVVSTGCPKEDDTGEIDNKTVDFDNDGYAESIDCNDRDAAIHPDAAETCNGLDDDCDGAVDEDTTTEFYADADGDGYGDSTQSTVACVAPAAHVADATDCDDADAAIHPDAAETCNGLDDDCDGDVDEDTTGTNVWYLDADADGYGDPANSTVACVAPAAHVADATDCDDTDSSVHPDAVEFCDGLDSNCNGEIDDFAIDAVPGYTDADGDGYGDATVSVVMVCDMSGYADNADDCDDANSGINPGMDEHCNGYDDNCDGVVDEDGAIGADAYYADLDGDTYGDHGSVRIACLQPAGYVTDDMDCDDTNAVVHPYATEYCDGSGIDEDCDGLVNDDDPSMDPSGLFALYHDADGDGYGNLATEAWYCSSPDSSWIGDATDCDDTDPSVYPGASEYCNDMDDDCDGTVDNDYAVDAATWYADADGDGYGDPTQATVACVAPSGFVASNTDCNDTDPAYNPGADESDCSDPNDYNCDGSVGYADNDGDGFAACEECDDSDPLVNPNADEYCDGVDNDCDGSTDEDDAVDAATWYYDADGDGYGDPTQAHVACVAPDAHVADATDCDDADATVNPDGNEVCDGVDNDCDGIVDEDDSLDADIWYADADGDGYGDPTRAHVACVAPVAYVASDTDCDDADASTYPGASEYCDGVDHDCDGIVDEDDSLDADIWYADSDADGYGDSAVSTTACSEPSGYISVDGDCDDTDPAYHPGASENHGCSDLNDYNCDGSIGTDDLDGDGFMACLECDDSNAAINPDADEYCDGVDNDCDDAVDEDDALDATVWYPDWDSDGYGDSLATSTETTVACVAPSGFVASNTDCDDSDHATYPGAVEICDDLDNDCDGTVDEGLSGATWYLDADSDGYGDLATTTYACGGTAPSGYVADDTDCDDSDATTYPGAEDRCNDGVDNDCDGADTTTISLDNLEYGDLVVTEFMTTPYRVADSAGEWIELYNASGCTIEVTDFNLDNAMGTEPASTSGCYTASISPNNFYVLGVATSSYFAPDCEYSYYDMTLSTSSDSVIVSTQTGTILDEVVWTTSYPGYTWSLDPNFFDSDANNDWGNWCLASSTFVTGDFGSPWNNNPTCF